MPEAKKTSRPGGDGQAPDDPRRELADLRRRLAELEQSEAALRMIVEASLNGVIVFQDGKAQFVNQAISRFSGYAPEELLGRPIFDLLHPEDRDLIVERHLTRLRGGDAPQNYQLRFIHKDGDLRWLTVAGVRVEWLGRPAVLCFFGDITDERFLQEELRRGAQELRNILDASPTAMFVIDRAHRITHWNRACEALTDFSADEVIRSQRHAEVFYGKDRPLLADLIVDGAPLAEMRRVYGPSVEPSPLIRGAFQAEGHFSSLGGAPTWLYFLAAPLKDADGQVVGAIETLFDVSQDKRAQKALRESELRYRALFEASSDAIFIFDGDALVDCNPAAEELLGFERQRMIGKPAWDASPDEQPDGRPSPEVARRMLALARRGQPQFFHWVSVKEGGQPVQLEMTLKSLDIPGRDLVLALARDVTERTKAEEEKRLLEEQLRQSQKMEALGTLAGGIAHDFNNILGAVMGYGELALSRAARGRDCAGEISQVLYAADRAKSLVRQILTFSRKVESRPRPMDLNSDVKRCVELLRNLIPKMIHIELDLAPDLALVSADSNQIEQVLINLGVNAADAMPGGGRLAIATRNLDVDQDFCQGRPDLSPGPYVLLEVTDSGQGMDQQTLDHIFDPFFTTKEVGHGTGLGLSTAYGIVKGHGGRIACRSAPGQGATFRVYLPALPEAAAALDPAQPAAPRRDLGGHETILVVDDEERLLGVARRGLEREGYMVITALNGEEALTVFEPMAGRIDLVVLDVGMPGMGGRRCLQRMRELKPDVKVLVASGYPPEGVLGQALEQKPDGFLPKPYQLDELLGVIRDVLDGTAPSLD
ncbi:PAS/PAC sensor hybrid histidine kinase [Desulfarculus baarsii DSM 2075]|uniref:histidine kinase n=1 Tax=Desulfarculus baarsii (strain ATCC 33931 / DSM 2075 / LMG 7858 / VKM B-1802 / 2st14) TaxID=644282 RepID=E1QLH1_DESB2|nr:PAS domain S-box protein [Desulfarculus baarsii]ADK86406.1 PAS/PAC sensor hybrid histidine kinase [Desulfarculus baarsii DSM 2075]